MAELSRAKSVHITVTGIILVVLGSGLFGLLYIVHGSSFTFGKSDIFDRKTAFWVAVPITVTGLVGVLAGISKKNALVTLYLLCSLVSTGLAGFVAVGYGFKVPTCELDAVKIVCYYFYY
ncbi:hypothetical protein QZH41_020336 [Actinostola sp. cb2023]|nr:hypothetical protein QZH41_020336 [Actinostola sp. cb2023]